MDSQHLPPLVRAMLEPGFYPHIVPDPIRLIQTHISYVFLTGDYAYKVKKAVDLGFVDFSTLEKRRHFCNEELRLNRRGAPGLYLQVLPITGQTGRPRLGGDGPAVEYAIQMRQFAQENLFSRLLQDGRLHESDIDELARVIADFHARAPSNAAVAAFGHPQRIAAGIENNYRQTERFVPWPQTRQQIDETRRFTGDYLTGRSELFVERIRAGRVRECHGDLHMNNICRLAGGIMLFDCIEFNDAFRCVDVMYDLAFALMDLEARGRPDLANVLLNVYLETTGDWEGAAVLPLYLCRQAYVRGKVNALLLEDPALSKECRDEAGDIAAGYFRQAWGYTRPRRGRLVLMCGLSGSGKSTIARKLSRRMQAIHLRSDAVRKHLAGIALHQRGGEEIYTDQMTRRTYARLLELGVRLAEGNAIILDATYARQRLRRRVITAAKTQQIPLRIVHCAAPPQVLQQRLHRPRSDISDATARLLARQQQSFERFTPAEQPLVTTIDTSAPEEQVESQLGREIYNWSG